MAPTRVTRSERAGRGKEHVRIKHLLAIGAVLAVILAGWLVFSPEHINDWPIKNLPVEEGPAICFGDSLVAGYGATSESAGYPAQLSSILKRNVVRVGTVGQTTAEGLTKLRGTPAIRAPLVIVTLGGNDILQRVPLDKTLNSLGSIFDELQARGATVAFTSVESVVPGKRPQAYLDLCRAHGVILVPDVLDGILRNDDLHSDAIHPNDKGYRLMAERVADVIRPFLAESD
jgi:lysophospholipase L1-like esterase